MIQLDLGRVTTKTANFNTPFLNFLCGSEFLICYIVKFAICHSYNGLFGYYAILQRCCDECIYKVVSL